MIAADVAGAYSRDGLLQIVYVDERPGIVRLTIREMIGGPSWGWRQAKSAVQERARKFAIRSVDGTGSTLVSRGYSSACFTWTFDVRLGIAP